jgi:DNA polymerase I-like protein with 3'-5' exonuclease and polymerase domains
MAKKKSNVSEKTLYGVDIETHDPLLKDKGESWIWNEGEILVASVHDDLRNDTSLVRPKDLKYFKMLFKDPSAIIVGANIGYDVLWICHVLKMNITDIKAEIIDIQITEALINPFTPYALGDLAVKYLNEDKGSGVLVELAKKHKMSGDFRAHLKKMIEMGYEKEVNEYVLSDAEQPVRIHKLQMQRIKELDCMNAFNIYHKANLVSMQMKQNGIRIDYEKWKANSEKLSEINEKLEKDFEKRYGKVNINAPAQVGKMFKENGYDVKFKVTVRGYKPKGDTKFNLKAHGFTKDQRKAAFEKLQAIVPTFVLEKEKLFLECASENAESMIKAFDKLGYNAIASPMVNKMTLQSSEAKVVTDYLILKQVREIQKKFLGENFERYFTFKDGSCRIHTSFLTVGARATGRFSSVKPNLQNIPARVVLWEGTKKQINISAMCREVFLPEEGHILVRLDYSGQENRWMAYFGTGEDGEFIRAKYREDPDFDEHSFVVQHSGLLEDHDAKIARKYAKTIRFAVAYGASVKRIAKGNNWEMGKAKDIVTKILHASPWFSITKESLVKSLSSGELSGIRTALNRFIICHMKDKAYKFYNYLIQGSGADQMKAGMGLVYDDVQKRNLTKKIIPILTIHDEMCYSIDPSAMSYVSRIKHLMENAVPVDVPFICDPEAGPNWAYTDKMTERDFEDREEDEDD